MWVGMLFASGTMAFQYYAQMWLIYELTESAWLLGSLGAIRGIATLLFGLYGGALADRMDRRILLLVTEVVAFVVAVVLGLMVIFGYESLWLIFSLIFLGSAAASIDAPIRQALIPELVAKEDIPNAVALTTAAFMGSFAITPILAGFVIVAIGPGGAYLVSSLGNIGILIALLMLHYRGKARSARHEPVMQTILKGISYTRSQSTILWVVVLTFVTSAFAFSLFHGLIAKWGGDVLGLTPSEYGLLAATWGFGTLVASYVMSWKGDIERHGRILIIASFLFALSFLLFSLARSIPLVGIIYVINGAAWTCASISSIAIVQRLVPDEFRGRVMSLFMLSGAVAQMNAMLLGFGADIVGLENLMLASTLTCTILVAVLILTVPKLRKLDRIE